jgi:acetyltransferase
MPTLPSGCETVKLSRDEAVCNASRAIKFAVRQITGIEHFQGVRVQPMVGLDGYELIIDSSLNSPFKPVLLFGTGGQLVEVFKDRSLGLPPLNTTLARWMMEQTRITTALRGVRGRRPVARFKEVMRPTSRI